MIDPYKNIPKSVRVGCFLFRIEVRDFEDHEAEGTFGHMNPISQKICLRPGMSAQNLADTFIHEVMHAIFWFHEAGRFTGDTEMSQVEEEFVTKGAHGLCQFWQDNPKAVVWWARLLKIEEAA